ncbi:MAG: hypothetical protein LBI72_00035 [Flavobacteriaceae bacterium]|jgi:hypothetical protein|nr:hypothetical protein [Flavobacteriaceae bacterium]
MKVHRALFCRITLFIDLLSKEEIKRNKLKKMRNKLGQIITLLVTLFLTIILVQSCAVTALSSEPMSFKKETAQNGLIIGSITFPKEKARFNGYFIRVSAKDIDEKVARKNSTEIQINPKQIWKVEHKGQLDNGRTYLFAIERPEGEYEFSSIRLFTNSGIAALQRTDYSGSFSIPFDVKKGEITYVGNIIFNEFADTNNTQVSYKNNYEKDINAMKTIQPTVDWSKAINDVNRRIEYNNNKVKR